MPLKCLRDGQELFAFNLPSDEEWNQLRTENATTHILRMACCPSTVVLKTSKLGTRYFAHSRRGECITAPETAEHLLAKSVIVAGVRRTPWEPRVEQSSSTPTGEAWIADVLASHEGKRAVAFEVQWSRQAREETLARQERYKAAGIRGLWLFRQYDLPLTAEVPAFRLTFDEMPKEFRVMMPAPFYDETWLSHANKDRAHFWQQTIELSRFVEGALTGRLQFAPALNRTMPLEVFTARDVCWRCGKETNSITDLKFAAGKVLLNCPDVHCSIYDFGKVADGGGAKVLGELLPGRLLATHNIGMIKPRYSKTERGAYISNGCVHCDALLGRFFDHDLGPGQLAISVDAYLDKAWATQLPGAERHINRWWFDDSF